MKAKSLLVTCVGVAIIFHTSTASGQYTPRSGRFPAGNRAAADRGDEGNPAGLGLAFVTYLSGESLLRSTDDEDWVALSPNLSLRIGDRVWAQDEAKIEIRFPLGATAWVNYQSELDITRMESGSRADTIQLALVSGEAAFDVKGYGRPGSAFQVDIANASLRASGAARFRVNTLPDGTAQIGVSSGTIVLETPDGLTDVSAGRMAEIQPDQRVLLDFLPVSDEWDDWVRSRAANFARPAASLRYLPADLSPYAHEFDTSGRWVKDPTYGFVWVPAVEQDWSPYSNGRWVWQANDYVWLSYDFWYAPFHYGRWSWGVSTGWFWIVPRGKASWSPGNVGWSISGDEVSWVPLGYNEVYYGYGSYGPHSVNVTRTTSVNVTNVYVNSRVKNGIVAVRKDNFLHGKIVHERIAPSLNPFQGGDAGAAKILGRPPVEELKPIRETRQSRPDAEMKRVSPPPVRLERESQTIRDRVVAPTKEKSAFKPGNTPAPLKNIRKEQELERWVPSRKAPTSRSDVAPYAAEHLQQGEARGKPTSAAVQGREAQPPAGKHQFKRMSESPGGERMAPTQKFRPKEEQQDEKEERPVKEERSRGGERGSGRER